MKKEEEKNVLLFFAEKGIFGLLSITTLFNLSRALDSLRDNKHDMLYIILGHSMLNKANAKSFIAEKLISNELHPFVQIATDCGRPFADQFALHLSYWKGVKKVSISVMEKNTSSYELIKFFINSAIIARKKEEGSSVLEVKFV